MKFAHKDKGVYSFSRFHKPVEYVDLGEPVILETEDAVGGQVKSEDTPLEKIDWNSPIMMLIGMASNAVAGRCAPGYITEAHTLYTKMAIGAITIILKIITSKAEIFLMSPDAFLT